MGLYPKIYVCQPIYKPILPLNLLKFTVVYQKIALLVDNL